MEVTVEMMRSVIAGIVDASWVFRSISPNSVWRGRHGWTGFIATHLDGRDIEVWGYREEVWLIVSDRDATYAVEIAGTPEPIIAVLVQRFVACDYHVVKKFFSKPRVEVVLGGQFSLTLHWAGPSRHQTRRRGGKGVSLGWEVAHRFALYGAEGGLITNFRSGWTKRRPLSFVYGSAPLDKDEGYPAPLLAMESDDVGRVLLTTLVKQCARRYRDVASAWLSNPGELAPVSMACVVPHRLGRFPVTVIWGIQEFRVLVGTAVWSVPIGPGFEFEAIGETISLIDEVVDRGVVEYSWARGALRASYLGQSRPPVIVAALATTNYSLPYS